MVEDYLYHVSENGVHHVGDEVFDPVTSGFFDHIQKIKRDYRKEEQNIS